MNTYPDYPIKDSEGRDRPADKTGRVGVIHICSNPKCKRVQRVDYPAVTKYFLNYKKVKGQRTLHWRPVPQFEHRWMGGTVWNAEPPREKCEACGWTIYKRKPVIGSVSEKKKCDVRCLDAVGDICVCSCGGDNHGASYLIGAL